MEPRLACLQNSHSILLPPHTPAGQSAPVIPSPSQALGGSSSRDLPPLLLFRKPVQEVLMGAVGQRGGSMGNETGPDLGEG